MQTKIELLDSTLRDGAQGEGITFSLSDKLAIANILKEFGITFIEAGNPASNPKDLEFFLKNPNDKHLVAFGSTRRKLTRVEDCPNVQGLLSAATETVCIFGKCWDYHVTEILATTLAENLAMIRDTVGFFVSQKKHVIFDCEHFFDGYLHNKDYALSALEAAKQAGARVLCLCDTNGGTMTDQIHHITKLVVEQFNKIKIGIHCHNDSDLAVANSIAAVHAGATHVQGTFLGIGERCGNANLSSIIANLQLKCGYQFTSDVTLNKLTDAAKAIAEITNIPLARACPFVGQSAFTHKAGMHADGVLKSSQSFEHIDPATVGNERRFLLSEIAGRGIILDKVKKFYPTLNKDSPQLKAIASTLKEQENIGYQYEGAEASFQLLVKKSIGSYTPSFHLVSFKCINEQPAIEGNIATAIVKIRVADHNKLSVAEGDGPVHALDQALRGALQSFYPQVNQITLTDYKVRVLTPSDATAAKVRVLITSTDGKEQWTTVGVSTDVIEASWKALVDSFEYKIYFHSKKE